MNKAVKSVLFILLFAVLITCGSDSGNINIEDGNTAAGTGSIVARAIWPDTSVNAIGYALSAMLPTESAVPSIVQTVRVIISGPGMSNMQTDFNASAGSGRISGVPAGTGRIVTMQGLDAGKTVIYEGSVSNITVSAGQTTDCGTVFMNLLFSDTQMKKLTASDAQEIDQFGSSVSMSGDYAIVGATSEDTGASNAGAAYIFYRNRDGDDNWGQVKKLTASDAQENAYFGNSVSISGDYAIVGAHLGRGDWTGAAYIFYRNQGSTDNWGEVTKLTASDAQAYDHFGSVSISGDYAIVGAWGEATGGFQAGAAYMFYRNQGGPNNWGEVAKITAPDAVTGDSFGISVSISDYYAIVGASREDPEGVLDAGAAYIVNRLNYQLPKLTASDAEEEDSFGVSVSISGDYAIVGAHMEDTASDRAGAAYIFYRNQGSTDIWGEVTKITAFDAEAVDYFGRSVSISGDYAIVGAPGDDTWGDSAGAAYILDRNLGWGQLAKLTASDADSWDEFGDSVSISGDYAIVGAYVEGGDWTGAAYIFYRNQGSTDNWGEVTKLTASDAQPFSSFGESVSISGDYAIVGACYDDAGGISDAGAAYIYYRHQGGTNSWGEVTRLTSSSAEMYGNFGSSVSISGDYAIVGASGEDPEGVSDAGVAYIFYRNQGGTDNWGEVTKLTASYAQPVDYFGDSVSISGDYAIVGAYTEDTWGDSAGAAYLFYRNEGGTDNWSQISKFTASDAEAGDWFGKSVSISGYYAIIGASREDPEGVSDAGAAYLFYR